MGSFFGSIQVRSEDRDAVKAAVESVAQECKRKFLVGPLLKGWIGIYPDGSGQDEVCAAAIAKHLDNVLLQLIVHDDDLFIYNLFRNGKLLSEYSSRPDYFGERSAADYERLKPKPDLFSDLVSSTEALTKMAHLLGTAEDAPKFIVEQDRLEQFANLLGIQNALTSYEYLSDGERGGIKNWKQFVHIPDQKAERTTAKDAEAALRREKLALQKDGFLCNEWLPPCRKQDARFWQADSCADPLNGGFIVLWRRGLGCRQPVQALRLQPPWESKPEPIDIEFSSTDAHALTISPTGNWLAFFDEGLRLWDWRQQRPIDDIRVDASPIAFSRDETLLLCRERQKFEVISLETRQIVRTIVPESPNTVVQALHPSNSFLVTRPRQDQLGIINLESGKLEKVLYSGSVEDWSHLATPSITNTFKNAGVGERELAEWKSAFVRGSDEVLSMKFSPDGLLLFCATTVGLRVHSWNELLAASGTTPRPLYAVTPCSEASTLQPQHYENYIYDVTLDVAQNRVLFGGIQGVIRFLNLGDGSTGTLVSPPGKSFMCRLELSHDRKFICCLCLPTLEERNRKPPRLQVWNYPALCKTAGLAC